MSPSLCLRSWGQIRFDVGGAESDPTPEAPDQPQTKSQFRPEGSRTSVPRRGWTQGRKRQSSPGEGSSLGALAPRLVPSRRASRPMPHHHNAPLMRLISRIDSTSSEPSRAALCEQRGDRSDGERGSGTGSQGVGATEVCAFGLGLH